MQANLSLLTRSVCMLLLFFISKYAFAIELNAQDAYSLRFQIQGGLPVVKAQVNGHPLNLEIDLGGSGQIALKPEVIQRLGLVAIGESKQSSDAFGKQQESAFYTLDSLELEGIPNQVFTAEVKKANPCWQLHGTRKMHLMAISVSTYLSNFS